MEEAIELGNYLPLSFKSQSEGAFIPRDHPSLHPHPAGRPARGCREADLPRLKPAFDNFQISSISVVNPQKSTKIPQNPLSELWGIYNVSDRRIVKHPAIRGDIVPLSGRLDLNQRPHDPQSCALPDCATPRNFTLKALKFPAIPAESPAPVVFERQVCSRHGQASRSRRNGSSTGALPQS
jgi:hypothetical protein